MALPPDADQSALQEYFDSFNWSGDGGAVFDPKERHAKDSYGPVRDFEDNRMDSFKGPATEMANLSGPGSTASTCTRS